MGFSAGGIGQVAEFLFRLKEIQQKQEEIVAQQVAARHAQGTQQTILEAQLSNTKQTLEVIKLTRIMTILTIALVLIGIVQILLYIVQILIMKGKL